MFSVDQGYGNSKTANYCFRTSIPEYDLEPLWAGDILTCDGRCYLIGKGPKAFIAEKINDEDYHLLIPAVIAKELKREGLPDRRNSLQNICNLFCVLVLLLQE